MAPPQSLPLSLTPLPTPQPQELSPPYAAACVSGAVAWGRGSMCLWVGLFMLGGWLCAFVCDCVWGCVCV